ncbi:MAG: hypothetical protein FJ387_17295 [Verrucomicrobia bacterium]|nr:hypothetical protein [Verrucomicrobiota bacterium]
MKPEVKERLLGRIVDRPILFMIGHALAFSAWFRWAVIGVLLVPIVIGIMVPKVWVISPPELPWQVRISGIDFIQALALRRSAERHLAVGDYQAGLAAYRAALDNYPTNLRLMRHFLEQVRLHAEAPRYYDSAIPQASLLLRVTQTNLLDLDLCVGVFEKYGLDLYSVSLLSRLKTDLSPPLQMAYFRALFHSEAMDEFQVYWDSFNEPEALFRDDRMRLYRAAFAAGWETDARFPKPIEFLEEYALDPKWEQSASRLLLYVYARQGDAAAYRELLDQLRTRRLDRIVDHLRYWRLLATVGRKADAAKLASEFPDMPGTAIETAWLAQAYFDLDQRERANRLLDRFTLGFGYFDWLWVMYGNLQLQARDWERVKQLANTIRRSDTMQQLLLAYSYYLEGRAELADGRPELAAVAFQKMTSKAMPSVELALQVSENLMTLGYLPAARQVLELVESLGKDVPTYWDRLTAIAYELKDGDLLMKTAFRAYKLQPKNLATLNNYAAALVLNRRSPEVAVRCTLELVRQLPERISVRIVHALALIQNGRHDEADVLLSTLSPAEMNEADRSVYFFACLETLVHQGRLELARAFDAGIDPALLWPRQQDRLQQLRLTLPKS